MIDIVKRELNAAQGILLGATIGAGLWGGIVYGIVAIVSAR
jgi:hypothetical protein